MTQGKKHYGTPTEFGFCIKVGMSLWSGVLGPSLSPSLPRGSLLPTKTHPGLLHDGFSLSPQPYKVRSGVKGLKLLCSEDEQSRSCWMAAFRLFKVSPGHNDVLLVPCWGDSNGMPGRCWKDTGGMLGRYQWDAGGMLEG